MGNFSYRHTRLLATIIFLLGTIFSARSQTGIWTDIPAADLTARRSGDPVPLQLRAVLLNQPALRSLLQSTPLETNVAVRNSPTTIMLPMPNGTMEKFRVVESPIMEPGLAAKFPEIKTYMFEGIDDRTATGRFDWTPQGFHAIILKPGAYFFIEPNLRGNTEQYIVYDGKDLPMPFDLKSCAVPPAQVAGKSGDPVNQLASGTQLRTYRLVVCATGEFYAGNGSTVASAQAAIVTIVNQDNAIYEREVAVRMVLVANNNKVIFTNAATDPFTNTAGNPCSTPLRSECQQACDDSIGNANYDIGHVFTGTNIGGCATIGSVCGGSKGWGASGVGFGNAAFDVSLSCHEMGHQFGANHTFNSAIGSCVGQYSASTAYEPGSGSTIMSYAGSCDNIQNNRDMFFHTISFDEIVAYTVSGGGNGCASTSATGNSAPSVNAGGSGFNIPINTPFTLTGSGSDPDEDPLTFSWEEFDLGPAGAPNSPSGNAPIFRSFPPVTSASRTFPRLSDIINNTQTLGEILPSYGRSLNFRLTARDNRAGGGGVDYASMSMTVVGTAGPFRVTSPNTAVNWCAGSHTVTWDVANTNVAPVSVANVKISLSTDGGNTFPIVLLASTPNDGSQSVNVPCTFSTQSRIKVEAVGNVFFDMSNANFTSGDNAAPTFTAPSNITLYKDDNCNYNASTGITGDVTDEDDDCDNTLNATFIDGTAAGSCDGETVITRTWSLTDDCGKTTVHVQTITIEDTTRPTFTEPADITIYKDQNCDHDASTGVTGDVTDEDDNCDNTLNATFSDVTVPGSCIGEEIITRTWTLSDDCGNMTSHTQVITVLDTLPPVIDNISPDPASLWPPNHQMVDVTINYTAEDNCSPVTNVLTVTSNQPVNGTGDGDTAPDWEVIDDHHVRLRAERAGNSKAGRIYTIYITSTDDCGNTSVDSTKVIVAHNMVHARTGINEQAQDLAVTALPNPSSSQFTISISGMINKGPVLMQVVDLSGKIVESRSLPMDATISIGENYRHGVYILRFIQADRTRVVKLIKLPD